jgi:hypothetical protein
MLHTPEAVEAFRPTSNFTGMNLDEYAHINKWAGVGLIPVTKNRDSEPLERSNFDSTIDELSDKFDGTNIGTINFGHWACGWLLVAVYNTGISGLAEAVADIDKRIKEYAILDEVLYSEYEWSDNHPEGYGECYSEDYDCSCGLPKA